MTFPALPLSYCTNVHPGQTVQEVLTGIFQFTLPIQEKAGFSIAAGLWLASAVTRELHADSEAISRFAAAVQQHGLACYTLNAFPFGNFHSERVKENVYLPDWTNPARLEYTLQCAEILSALLPEGMQGSISTVPLGFKPLVTGDPNAFLSRCVDQLLVLAEKLDELHDSTGKLIRVAIEPEPLCVIETTGEAISFFNLLRDRAGSANTLDLASRHLGLCYDVCHQSVEYEDVARSIAAIEQADIRINKVHLTCAIEVPTPADIEQRSDLARYAEQRYLHQSFARSSSGQIHTVGDLTSEFAASPPLEFLTAESWRVHFHVPLAAETLGLLGTTRSDLWAALRAVRTLPYAPHLEVETYTWEKLPPGVAHDLVTGFANDMREARQMLATIESETSAGSKAT